MVSVELKAFLIQNNYHIKIKSLSFIGFSMGGLIIRACLPYLPECSDRLGFLMTFNTPHLGVSFKTTSMSDIGLWIINKFVKRDSSIKQIAMGDKKDLRDCYLYLLSKSEYMGLFKYVILVGSQGDSYVKSDSCFAFADKIIKSESIDNKVVFEEMIDNMWKKLMCKEVIRVHVPFKDFAKDIESMIGKKSHIHIIANFYSCNILINHFSFLFN